MALMLARCLRRFAWSLNRLAARLEPAEPVRAYVPGEQTRAARALADEMNLRRALHDSLRRFSPHEPPAQA